MYGIIKEIGPLAEKCFALQRIIDKPKINFVPSDHQIEQGQYLKVFNSIAGGKVLLEIPNIAWDHDDNSYKLYPQKISHNLWDKIVSHHLPVKLQKHGREAIDGKIVWQQDCRREQPHWILEPYIPNGSSREITIDAQDKLTIYSEVHDGNVQWLEQIKMKINKAPVGKAKQRFAFHHIEPALPLLDIFAKQSLPAMMGKLAGCVPFTIRNEEANNVLGLPKVEGRVLELVR